MPFFSARPTAVFNVRAKGRLPFKFRQIITTGYTAAGYRDTVTWRNVNSINASTDTSTNRGDLLQNGGSYVAGLHGRNNAFIFGTNGTGSEGWGAFSTTSCFNMRNNTTLTKPPGIDTPTNVASSFGMMASDGDGTYYKGWFNGGNFTQVTRRFNLVTETLDGTVATSLAQATADTGGGTAGIMDENFGVWFNDAGTRLRFTFATETETTPSATYGFHGQQKGISSKNGFSWAGNEGSYNSGYNLRKTNTVTDTQVGTPAKPIGDSGEENFTMGQDHQYMLGMYGAPGPVQSNRSWRWNYATDSGFEGGASMQPSGTQSGTGSSVGSAIAGRSSGVGFWRD